MNANTQLSLLELLDALPATAEREVTEFVRKVFSARRGCEGPFPETSKPAASLTEYNKFTRAMMPVVRRDFPEASPQELMRIVAKAWKALGAKRPQTQSS